LSAELRIGKVDQATLRLLIGYNRYWVDAFRTQFLGRAVQVFCDLVALLGMAQSGRGNPPLVCYLT